MANILFASSKNLKKSKEKKGKEKKTCLCAHLKGFQTQLVDDFHEPKMWGGNKKGISDHTCSTMMGVFFGSSGLITLWKNKWIY